MVLQKKFWGLCIFPNKISFKCNHICLINFLILDIHFIMIRSDFCVLKIASKCQGCHGQGKYLENEIFPGQGKVREFYGWPGKFRKDLESQGI